MILTCLKDVLQSNPFSGVSLQQVTDQLEKEVLDSHPASDIQTYYSCLVYQVSEQLLTNIQKLPLEYRPFAQTKPTAKTFGELLRSYISDLKAAEVVQKVKLQHLP